MVASDGDLTDKSGSDMPGKGVEDAEVRWDGMRVKVETVNKKTMIKAVPSLRVKFQGESAYLGGAEIFLRGEDFLCHTNLLPIDLQIKSNKNVSTGRFENSRTTEFHAIPKPFVPNNFDFWKCIFLTLLSLFVHFSRPNYFSALCRSIASKDDMTTVLIEIRNLYTASVVYEGAQLLSVRF